MFLGKGGNTGKTLSHAKHTSVVSSPAQVRPFAGKVFYLDLPSNRTAETLESDIKELGGVRNKRNREKQTVQTLSCLLSPHNVMFLYTVTN